MEIVCGNKTIPLRKKLKVSDLRGGKNVTRYPGRNLVQEEKGIKKEFPIAEVNKRIKGKKVMTRTTGRGSIGD